MMSVFTNPSNAAAEHAQAYIEAVLDLVRDRDPIAVLRSTAEVVQAVLAETPASLLHVPEKPGKWSMAAVVLHLADSDIVWAWRLRLVIAEDQPALTGYDQDRWAEHLGYDDVDLDQAMATFDALRASNLRLLDRATPAVLGRFGIHVERGKETVEHMTRLYAGHDLVHRNQLLRIRDAVSDRQP